MSWTCFGLDHSPAAGAERTAVVGTTVGLADVAALVRAGLVMARPSLAESSAGVVVAGDYMVVGNALAFFADTWCSNVLVHFNDSAKAISMCVPLVNLQLMLVKVFMMTVFLRLMRGIVKRLSKNRSLLRAFYESGQQVGGHTTWPRYAFTDAQ